MTVYYIWLIDLQTGKVTSKDPLTSVEAKDCQDARIQGGQILNVLLPRYNSIVATSDPNWTQGTLGVARLPLSD